jgi:hypothetical protein
VSAIQLPVTISTDPEHPAWFRVCEADGTVLVARTSGPHAEQISIALNLHDELVAELERLQGHLGEPDYDIVAALLARAQPK